MDPQDQNAVNNQPVATTTPMDSAPIERQSTDAQEAPAGELTPSEKKVSESVPYERFKEVNDRLRQLEQMVAPPQPTYTPPVNDVPELEPEADMAVDYKVRRVLEEQKAREFAQRHAKELENPLLRGLTKELIAEHRQRGEYIDQEVALERAKSMVAEQAKPQIQEAEQSAFETGQALARTRQMHGAVGETNRSNPKPDPEQMSASDYARYYNLPRV